MSLADKPFNVGIIGVGIMGEALLAGLISAGYPNTKIKFYEKRAERVTEITSRYNINFAELSELCQNSNLILLVTKPQDLGALLNDISANLDNSKTLVSFAAGKTIDYITNLSNGAHVIRVMPNTPVLVNKGMSAISAGKSVGASEINFVKEFLDKCGKAVIVDESLQDAVTATSGSGPAYFFAFVEEMIKGAVELGLNESDATTLTIQTIAGAAQMLEESGKSPTTLRENVTSPNGTTAAALTKFQEGDLGKLISTAMQAARDRSIELA